MIKYKLAEYIMKRNIFLMILLLLSLYVNGQQDFLITGRLIDKKSKEPLPYGAIVYQQKSTGTVSNNDGYFTFSIYGANRSDSILISYLGYKPIKLAISQSIEIEKYELIPDDLELKEVVVTPQKIKLRSFIKDVISDYNNNRREKPHIAIAHYREKAKENDRYIMYMESTGYSVFMGKQANAAKLSNYKFFCENTRCHVSDPQWIKYKDNSPSYFEQNVSPSGGANLNVFRYLELHGLLSKKHYSKYKYEIDSTYSIGNSEVYRIKFDGKIAKGMLHAFAESKRILKIECVTDSYWSQAFNKRLNAKVDIGFNYFERTPFISSIKASYGHQGLIYKNDLEVLVQKFNGFVLGNDEYWSLDTYNINPYIEYKPQEWMKVNIEKDRDYDIIEKDLCSGKGSLEQHFEDYSGRWFSPNSINKSELARSVIKRLKQNF